MEHKGETIDWGKDCFWYGFDVMGALGWGMDFEMVKTQKTAHVIDVSMSLANVVRKSADFSTPLQLVESFMAMVQALGNVSYVCHPLTTVPSPAGAL
jgi:hypothetical protein